MVVALLLPLRAARAASDPSLAWYTLVTPHYRVTYHSGLERVAQRVASVAEGINETMVEHVGWRPGELTEIYLADITESANGSATPLPYNAIRLYVTAPDDLSPLGDVDDWYLGLVTHELTHVLHTDNIHGLPVVVNAVLGKTLAPNSAQPRWILEGLGVYQESARTSAGRLRNSMWRMFMRADVLEDNVAPIDQITGNIRRWPQGNLWYLYGSYFTDYIAATFGEQALRATARDYGGQLIPGGFNRSLRRATGKTYVELYPSFIASLRRTFEQEDADVRRLGLREGTRLTHHGQIARYPRWIPEGTWKGRTGSLLYYRDDQHVRPGLYVLPLTRDASGVVRGAKEEDSMLVARTPAEAYATFAPDGSLVFTSPEVYKNVFTFDDLARLPAGGRSAFGSPDGGRVRLTHGLRASDPAVSPDGRRVVFVQNRRGVRTLLIGDLEEDAVTNVRVLVPSAALEQAYTPRWSPDGERVVYSAWRAGGYRDIRLVDVASGRVFAVTDDRAIDGGPSWTPDGRFVLFHSDRTGISNVFAWDIATAQTFQVTNVRTGAFSPDVSPDGKTLAYVGYTSAGFDLFAMPFDQAHMPLAPPYVDDHPVAPTVKERTFPVQAYSPLRTLWPRRYSVQITPGNYGQAIALGIQQTDIAGLHTVALSTVIELEKPVLQGALGYNYGRLPFDVGVSAFRTITPRGGLEVGEFKPVITQEAIGFASSIVFSDPTPYDVRSYVVTQSVSRIENDAGIPASAVDPYATPQIPRGSLASTLHLGYGYSNAERLLWSVGPERGYSLGLAVDLTDPALGSELSGFAANGDLTAYLQMPWLRHHSLALHAGTGTSGGNFPGRGAFYVGGFVDLPLVDTIRNQLLQGGIVLRGYAPVTLSGRSYVLGNAEYRFPIVNVDRGLSTLPFQVNRLTGAAFVDYGSAFENFRSAPFKTGVGGELWLESTIGYNLSFIFRLGYARGLASGGIDKVYVVAAVPY